MQELPFFVVSWPVRLVGRVVFKLVGGLAGRLVAPLVAVATLLTGGCTSYESAYERSVTDYEPIYCYQSLGGVTCHRQPDHRDARRLVNYYGPAPSKYDAPNAPELAQLASPPKGGKVVRDAEPRVTAARPDDGTAVTASGGTTKVMASTKDGEATKMVLVREEGGDWRYYLPFLTVLFGAAQVAAAFLF
ncbi:MAG: hypothetical protein U1E42_14575 [Rhodospirillales bacterium]